MKTTVWGESRFPARFLGVLAPLGFAFGAGLVSAVNPCGFVMLPAYMGLYLGTADRGVESVNPIRRLGRALVVGGTVTAGFVALFGVAGIAIGLGARSIVEGAIPWFGLVIGVLLALAGVWLLSGGKMYSGLVARAAAHIGNPGQVGIPSFFLFGLSYATASLGCTLPVFLIVVGTSLAAAGDLPSLGQFVMYALGIAIFKGAMVGKLRRVLPYVERAGSLLMILAGSYIVSYWLTLGGLM